MIHLRVSLQTSLGYSSRRASLSPVALVPIASPHMREQFHYNIVNKHIVRKTSDCVILYDKYLIIPETIIVMMIRPHETGESAALLDVVDLVNTETLVNGLTIGDHGDVTVTGLVVLVL